MFLEGDFFKQSCANEFANSVSINNVRPLTLHQV